MMVISDRYQWIVSLIAQTKPTESTQVRLALAWLSAFFARLGKSLENATYAELLAFCAERHQAGRSDASMARLVRSIKNIYATVVAAKVMVEDPSSRLTWSCPTAQPASLAIDLTAVDDLIEFAEGECSACNERANWLVPARTLLEIYVAAEAGGACAELANLSLDDIGITVGTVILARGTDKERLGILAGPGLEHARRYIRRRRELPSIGTHLFVCSRRPHHGQGVKDVCTELQKLIHSAGLSQRLKPSDLCRSLASRLLKTGEGRHMATRLIGRKKVPNFPGEPVEGFDPWAALAHHPLF
jgi:site-specific recombinase XerD